MTPQELLPFATAAQAEKINAWAEHGSFRAAAKALGYHESAVRRAVAAVQRKAGMRPPGKEGWSPVEVTEHFDGDGQLTGKSVRSGPEDWAEQGGIGAGPARDGTEDYVVKGVSTYYNAAGEQRGQWVKTKIDDAKRIEMLKAAAAAMAEDLPRIVAVPMPGPSDSKLLNLFTLSDAHIGALAWHREGGADWDLSIAEKTILAAFSHMVVAAPRAKVAVVNQLGDLLHQDSNKAVTPASGHLLDADGRMRKIIGVAIRVLRRIIDMALATHEHVHVIMGEGNHDEISSAWLQTMFAALYENEPRVTIDDSALPYYAYQHGRTMLAFHHGHMKKNDQLPLYFAAAYPEMWGATRKRFAHVGHRHHVEEKEHSGMKVVQHSTIAARDAYAARGGWMTERQIITITYHEEFGEVARSTVTPEMLS